MGAAIAFHGIRLYLDKADPDLTWLDIDFLKDNSGFKITPDSKRCPECKDQYLTRFTDRLSHTVVDICSSCRGSWLKAKQLRHIIEAIKLKW